MDESTSHAGRSAVGPACTWEGCHAWSSTGVERTLNVAAPGHHLGKRHRSSGCRSDAEGTPGGARRTPPGYCKSPPHRRASIARPRPSYAPSCATAGEFVNPARLNVVTARLRPLRSTGEPRDPPRSQGPDVLLYAQRVRGTHRRRKRVFDTRTGHALLCHREASDDELGGRPAASHGEAVEQRDTLHCL